MTKRIEEAADLTTLWACARQTLNLKPLTEAKKLLFAMPQGFSAKSSLSLSLSLSLTHTHTQTKYSKGSRLLQNRCTHKKAPN